QSAIPCYGVELTPLGVLIGKVRLWPPADLEQAVSLAEQLAKVHVRRKEHGVCPELVSWIGQANARKLSYLLENTEQIEDRRLRRWMTLAISSSLRPASKWLSGSIIPQIDPDRPPTPIGVHFLRAARQLKRDCEREHEVQWATSLTTIVRGDARKIALPDGLVDAVITSPPYQGMYDYYDVHRLTYLAFGWKRQRQLQIGRTVDIEVDGVAFTPPQLMESWYVDEFRREETLEGRALRDYFDGMAHHFKEIARLIRKDGVLVYALANSFRRGKPFELVEYASGEAFNYPQFS